LKTLKVFSLFNLKKNKDKELEPENRANRIKRLRPIEASPTANVKREKIKLIGIVEVLKLKTQSKVTVRVKISKVKRNSKIWFLFK